MAHFCGFIKLIFLLLMLARMGETRPQKDRTSTKSSDLIAGNEFLKLFMGHDELAREFYKRHQTENAGAVNGNANDFKDSQEFDKKSAETGKTRETNSRSLKIQGPKSNQAEGQLENSKQIAKESSGSKIAFLEDYDENDAILDAEARGLDLKREKVKGKEDYKILSVSVSSSSSSSSSASSASSSQRGSTTGRNRLTATTSKYDNKSYTSTKSSVTVTPRPRPPTATTYKPSTSTSSTSSTKSAAAAAAAQATGDNFINRSHKSEFSVEEVQPSAAKQHQQLLQQQRKATRKPYTRHRSYPPITSVADTLEAMDSENSASTNVVQNVLATPLQTSASALRSTSTVTNTYHSGQRNVSINHDTTSQAHKVAPVDSDISKDIDQQQSATGVEDQLLPFQTVIYHDTKSGGHGPQSRSISYSSISQNVEDLKKWHQSGILAEARRNVSESLKALPGAHQSEPSKFYSQPSKMYSEPSKFYSEPAKVYSEPSKVYGEPEKFYSEPAKVYGQPSKFYGEPSKVYSEPAKMYGEPAKTYWPVTLTTTSSTTTSSTSRPITTTNSPQITTTTPKPIIYQPSRKPAIVSRIAFGEAHSSTSTTMTTTSSSSISSTTSPSIITTTTTGKPTPPTFGSSYQHNHQRTYGHHRQPPSAQAENAPATSAPARRILFNLDRLPYDLLNAPQPATQQPATLELPQQPTLTYHQQSPPSQPQSQHPAAQPRQPQRHHNINPCLESAVSSLFSSSTLSAHPALIKQRQQHSSLSDQQHSNQNAKGLPNGDLVRCVAEISNTATASSSDGADDGGLLYTTERSNIEELFTPTPEQNYEMEESVSVMTNGRAHGIQGGGAGRNSLTLPTPPPPQSAVHPFQPSRQRIHFGTNLNGGVDGGGGHLSQSSFNTNANANGDALGNSHQQQSHRNFHAEGNPSPDYNSYDDGGGDDDNVNDDYTDDDTAARHRGSGASNTGDGDDSKVAYVVEGRNYRKYRVEEKTDDGFIVGEYGVVDHNDGNLRGVRYTADSTINRSLIQKALLTFLKLK